MRKLKSRNVRVVEGLLLADSAQINLINSRSSPLRRIPCLSLDPHGEGNRSTSPVSSCASEIHLFFFLQLMLSNQVSWNECASENPL